jgi:hypothetical protein
MCLVWVVGVFGATGACSNLAYLRGSQRMPSALEADAEDPGTHPWIRSGVVRERARLEALAEQHRVAFPLAVAKLLLNVLLVLAAGAALTGRRNARTFALQVIAASAALAAVDWVLMSEAREAMAQAVAIDAVDSGVGKLPDMDREQSVDLVRGIHLWAERFRLALLLFGVFGASAYTLTRPRTKEFFATAAADGAPEDPSSPDDDE